MTSPTTGRTLIQDNLSRLIAALLLFVIVAAGVLIDEAPLWSKVAAAVPALVSLILLALWVRLPWSEWTRRGGRRLILALSPLAMAGIIIGLGATVWAPDSSPLRFSVNIESPFGPRTFAIPTIVPKDALPGPPSMREGVPGPLGCGEDLERWLEQQGAIEAGKTHLKITIEGVSTSPVLIQGMQARIEARGDPIDETVVSCPVEGEIGVIKIGFDLDERPAIARVLEEDGSLGEPYFEDSNIRVVAGEALPLELTAFTEKCYCRWLVEVHAIVAGEHHQFLLDNEGQPFQTTAIVTVPSRRAILYAGEWGYCAGEMACMPDGLPGRTKPYPYGEEFIGEPTVQVLPPYS